MAQNSLFDLRSCINVALARTACLLSKSRLINNTFFQSALRNYPKNIKNAFVEQATHFTTSFRGRFCKQACVDNASKQKKPISVAEMEYLKIVKDLHNFRSSEIAKTLNKRSKTPSRASLSHVQRGISVQNSPTSRNEQE